MYIGDDAPFEVIDFEVPPADDQVGGDVIEAARGVRFSIKKADVRQNDEKTIMRLNVQSKVGPLGVDSNGRYANKILFAELLVWADLNVHTTDWWKKQARFPWKQFQGALGLDASKATRINDEFLSGLIGQEFIADIRKSEIRQKNDDGKYEGTGSFKNELMNFKKAE